MMTSLISIPYFLRCEADDVLGELVSGGLLGPGVLVVLDIMKEEGGRVNAEDISQIQKPPMRLPPGVVEWMSEKINLFGNSGLCCCYLSVS